MDTLSYVMGKKIGASGSEYAQKSEGFARGTQNGTDVSSDSPYYQNNSKYYAEQAAAVAESISKDYTKLSSEVDDLKSTLTSKADASDVEALEDALDGKADKSDLETLGLSVIDGMLQVTYG